MSIVITKPSVIDAEGIQDVYYKTWLDTYPNDGLGITKEAIEESFKNRLSESVLQQRRERIKNPRENEFSLVAKDGDKVVGVCRVEKHTDYNQLTTIYVLPEYQGKGIGKMLWNEAKNFFDAKKDIIVNVATYNAKTIAFYTKLGFVDTGKRFTEEHLKSGVNFPEMEMRLKNSQQNS